MTAPDAEVTALIARARADRARNLRRQRVVDALLLPPMLAAALPLLVAVWIVVRATSRGAAIFGQEREGLDGRLFILFKFRTMYSDADARLRRHLADHPARALEWERFYKLDPADDPRLTPVGAFLRRSSLDELPNLFNVLRGEVSIVGPRPFPVYHLAQFPETVRQLRRQVRPGLTGVWQVARGDLTRQVDADVEYFRRQSLGYDLGLVARTIPMIVRGKAWY